MGSSHLNHRDTVSIQLDDERQAALIRQLQGFYLEQFDEDLTAFRAEQLLGFMLEAVGPQVYNHAVQDARQWMQRKLDDLEGDVYARGEP